MRRSDLSWVLAGLAVGLGLARLGLVIDDAGGPSVIQGLKVPASDAAGTAADTLMLALFASLGALVAWRRPANPIGWLLLTTAVSFGCVLFAERLGWHYLLADERISERVAFWLWVANWTWIPAVVPLFIHLPLLFPTGRPLTPRWGRVVRVTSLVAAVFVVAAALRAGPLENYTAATNPFGTDLAPGIMTDVGFGLCGIGALAAVGSLALRFRSAHDAERQQIKWVWAAGTLLVMCFVVSASLEGRVDEDVSESVLFVGLMSVPAAVAVSILRYHLFDIAVVVNRTLVYVSLTAALALVYLAGVLLLQLILRPVTEASGLAVAVSTLAVASLFRPVRGRIQELVDMRFYRRKYDAARTLDAFNARLRQEIDLDSLSGELQAVLHETMQPSHASLWLRAPDGEM